MESTGHSQQIIYFADQFCKAREDNRTEFVPVDLWKPKNDNEIIITCKHGWMMVPLTILFDLDIDENSDLNYFVLSTKKCYNLPTMRTHLFQYINYFCNYYDPSWEYMSILFAMKLKIDRCNSSVYPVENFFYDLERYLLQGEIVNKVWRMVEDNYYQELHYSNTKNPNLQYTNDHAKILHAMSLLMNLCIPLLTHYIYMHKIEAVDDFLLMFYDKILHIRNDIDIYAKLYDTVFTNVIANKNNNQGIWIKQDIRSIDTTTHSTDSVYNIILNIMPKYTFDRNIIGFNYASIRRNTSYKITDISFEFSFIPISSSKRDDDSISDFDRFESNMIRMNEGLYLQNKINEQYCMRNIEANFGPFDQAEIDHYTQRILVDKDGNYSINAFQKQLIFGLFYRWFKDTQSIHAINRNDYVKLIIAAKRLLLSKNMVILPYILAGRIEKLVQRKTVNKKEKIIVESSPSYPRILEKYKSSDMTNHILSIVAAILSSEFSIVDIDPEIDGRRLNINSVVNAVIEEIETFILMC